MLQFAADVVQQTKMQSDWISLWKTHEKHAGEGLKNYRCWGTGHAKQF